MSLQALRERAIARAELERIRAEKISIRERVFMYIRNGDVHRLAEALDDPGELANYK